MKIKKRRTKFGNVNMDMLTSVYSLGTYLIHGKDMPGMFPKNMTFKERACMVDRALDLALLLNLACFHHEELWKEKEA